MEKIKENMAAISLIILSLIIFFGGITFSKNLFCSDNSTTGNKSPNTTLTAQENSLSQSYNIVYVVKEYNGKIAVFEKGADIPFKITGVNISDLPEKDRELLKNGIETNSQKELNMVLEDYCS